MADTAPLDAWAADAEAELTRVASDMEADVRRELDTPYPGPSAPGEEPHRRTGNLQAGVTVTAARTGRTLTLTFDSSAPYSRDLEEGTNRMDARPFVGPALAKWAPEIVVRLQAISIP